MVTSTRKRKGKNRQPTIALFSGTPGGNWGFEKWLVWRGISDAAREWNFNLIYIAGEEFEHMPQAILYDLISENNVDGVITWNSFVGARSQTALYQQFVDRFSPLPVVSIERQLEGCSNILIDNHQGMRDLVAHLVDVHHYQRIAFISQKNNQISEIRQLAFADHMSDRGIYDHTLVGELSELYDRGIVPGRDFQAVIALSDWEALLLIDELRSRGIRIPEKVAVAGFNDGMDARGSQPALTTIRLPFRNMGRRSVEMLIQRMNNVHNLEISWMPLQLTVRRSCGCLEPMAEGAGGGRRQVRRSPRAQSLPLQKPVILAEMSRHMGTSVDKLSNSWAEKLFDSFIAELDRHQDNGQNSKVSPNYLRDLDYLLRFAIEEGSNVTRWHEALTILRRHLHPYLDDEALEFAEDLWQQCRVLIGQAAIRAIIHRSWETAQRAEILREIEASLLLAANFNQLLDILVESLPRLKVTDFFLALYEDPTKPDGMVRLALAFQNGLRTEIHPDHAVFPASKLLPDGWLSEMEPYEMVLEALHLADYHIGYMIVKGNPPEDSAMCDIYQQLRLQLISAIKEVRLRQALQQALQKAEEANQLKSQFLSMVSHELRTPLNLIVGLSEMALRQQMVGNEASAKTMQKYLEQIFVSGQHLDRLIRDVLDLASSQVGQMKLLRENLDFIPVLRETASLGQQMAEQKNLLFRVNIPDQLPRVWGDKTRLRQVLLNLISNAVKFTAHGEVTMNAWVENDTINISIQDTGLGISAEEQEKIFDEFYQSNRSAARGYGGIGLGLAITRRLVEMHDGKIWVTSNGVNGIGSTFQFSLPVFTGTPGMGEFHRDLTNDTVLMICESPHSAQALSDQLCSLGYQVEISSYDELDIIFPSLQTSQPRAIMMDLSPDSELGWMIMKQLKDNAATQDIPVLFYSLIAGQETGAIIEFDYLEKPLASEDLSSILDRYGLKNQPRKPPVTILIIEDEPGYLELNTRMISDQLPHSRILTAQNGQDGLQVMRQEHPDLVLLDLIMPELDGFGVLKAMQEEKMLRNIPVVILSAQFLTEQELKRLNQGVTAILSKGLFSNAEMMSRIDLALSRSKRMGGESQRLVQRAMAYIHENYRDPLSRVDIANHLCINEQYLSRCFKNELGIGPMTYLSRFRIEQAKRLLENNHMTITQVALEVGLSSQSYFSRLFQQVTGLTPSAYRRGERPLANGEVTKIHN